MTKAELIQEILGEDPSVQQVLDLGSLSIDRLEQMLRDEQRRTAARERAWGNRRCKCGKLNRNCDELMHQVYAIEPRPESPLSMWMAERAATMEQRDDVEG